MKGSKHTIGKGVMLNAYPDSIGTSLSDTVAMLQKEAFKDVFSMFYILPTFFNSDLDRGFSIIDYDMNEELVTMADVNALKALHIELKFDIVLNHLSVASPQFKDLLAKGSQSKYKDFFINWNTFWEGHATLNEEGVMVPNKEYLDKLFMRKPGLPVLKVRFPDGSEQPYWNTFYQQIDYQPITPKDIAHLDLAKDAAITICETINKALAAKTPIAAIPLAGYETHKNAILKVLEAKKTYLGQMDVNGKSPLVWSFYQETLTKLKEYGCQILRLDAFAYLHKAIGESNFFNVPGTWDYLERIQTIAQQNDLLLLPEIHAEYGLGLHHEVAEKGYYIYDFFLPGLVLHTLEKGSNTALIHWANEIVTNGYKTVNMLGCHDGIPVLDLKGKEVNGHYNKGLLEDDEIEAIMNTIMQRGGRVKNLYDPAGNKISYYQVNATFFSALGENDAKLLLARAIQLFMPGIPQIWYLDIFAGTNDYAAAHEGGSGGHKEINRTTLTHKDIEVGLEKDVVLHQLKMIRLRNTSKAFYGNITIANSSENELDILWSFEDETAQLVANLTHYSFKIIHTVKGTVTAYTF